MITVGWDRKVTIFLDTNEEPHECVPTKVLDANGTRHRGYGLNFGIKFYLAMTEI